MNGGRWDNIIRQPEHEPLGPFKVYRQTTGALIVADNRRPFAKQIIVEGFLTHEEERAIAAARKLAEAEGFLGVTLAEGC